MSGFWSIRIHLRKLKSEIVKGTLNSNPEKYIAVLLTCFNRVEITRECLNQLFMATIPENIHLEVFLVDDASPDGTGELIKAEFPEVNVYRGTGDLFWNKGMRMAWEKAAQKRDFDYYLWLNDDTLVKKDFLLSILKDDEILNSTSMIVGGIESRQFGKMSYGGHRGEVSILPNGGPQEVEFSNGNLVLIPKKVFQKVGMLDKKFTHLYGDFDYSLCVQEAGLKCYCSSEYLGYCEENEHSYWGAKNLSKFQKLKLLHSPKGVHLSKCYYYKKKHYGHMTAIKTVVDAYARTLFPSFHQKMKAIAGK